MPTLLNWLTFQPIQFFDSTRSSPRLDRRGRTPMSNASLARSVANVSITSSSSMSVTCAVCCRHTLNTTTEAARISRSTRIAPSLVLYSHPLQVPSLPSHRSAVCTIATSVARPEPFTATEPVPPSYCRAPSRSSIASLGCRRAQNPCGESASQESSALVDHRTSSTVAFISKPIPRLDRLLSRDKALHSGRSQYRASSPFTAPHLEHFHTDHLLSLVTGNHGATVGTTMVRGR